MSQGVGLASCLPKTAWPLRLRPGSTTWADQPTTTGRGQTLHPHRSSSTAIRFHHIAASALHTSLDISHIADYVAERCYRHSGTSQQTRLSHRPGTLTQSYIIAAQRSGSHRPTRTWQPIAVTHPYAADIAQARSAPRLTAKSIQAHRDASQHIPARQPHSSF